MAFWRRSKPAVRRMYLGPSEREELAHSGFLQRDGELVACLYFNDGRPDYSARVPPRLARKLTGFLEAAMLEIDVLMAEDVHLPAAPSPSRR